MMQRSGSTSHVSSPGCLLEINWGSDSVLSLLLQRPITGFKGLKTFNNPVSPRPVGLCHLDFVTVSSWALQLLESAYLTSTLTSNQPSPQTRAYPHYVHHKMSTSVLTSAMGA